MHGGDLWHRVGVYFGLVSEPPIAADDYRLTLRPDGEIEIATFLASVFVTATLFVVAVITDDGTVAGHVAGLAVATLMFAAVRHWEARRRIPRGTLPSPPGDATILATRRTGLTPGRAARAALRIVPLAIGAAVLVAGLDALIDSDSGLCIVGGVILGGAINELLVTLRIRHWQRHHRGTVLIGTAPDHTPLLFAQPS